MLTIRQAIDGDVDFIEKITRDCFKNTKEVWTKEAIEFAIKDNSYKVFVGLFDNIIVGFIIMTYSEYEAYITQMAISPSYQGLGYGYEIIDFILKNVDSEIFVLEVRVTNTAAISLYEKCGFTQEGKRKNLYETPIEDAIVMLRRGD